MFTLTEEPIQPSCLKHEGAGGFVSFEGKVRNIANGREVVLLEYEAYPELAQSEGDLLVAEAVELFGLLAVEVIHRVGRLLVGETAVLIRTAAAHRREAFAGCEWIIDQLKVRVPIWKRETYRDGDSGWVGADHAPANVDENQAYFERQTRLEEFGTEGQHKLLAIRVLLVGVGGLASGSLPYLVAAGVGTLGLVDEDAIELSNLHRQIIYQAQDVGRSKVERAASFAKRLRPGVNIETHHVLLGLDNVDSLISGYDWVVDGTDSLRVKAILNAACQRLGKPLVTASVHRFEGQVLTVAPGGPCLNCLFPELPDDRCVGSCAETGVAGVAPGMLGMFQAVEVLKGVLGFGDLLTHRMVLVDLRTSETTSLQRQKRHGCLGCRGRLTDGGCDFEFASLEAAKLELGEFWLVDIRDLDEVPTIADPHVRIPVANFDPEEIAGPVVLICAAGVRSYQLAERLRGLGHANIYTFTGGLQALSGAESQR